MTYAEAIAIYNRSSAAERQAVLDRLPTTRRPTYEWKNTETGKQRWHGL